jgi:hypothetical protein
LQRLFLRGIQETRASNSISGSEPPP